MVKYIKKFEHHSDYEEFTKGGGYKSPNLSYCKEDLDVHYDEYEPVFGFAVSGLNGSNSTIRVCRTVSSVTENLMYSIDSGKTWNNYEFTNGSGKSITIYVRNASKRDELLFKGDNKTMINHRFFISGDYVNAFGDLRALVGKVYKERDTKIDNYCFKGLFSGCTKLLHFPDLPDIELSDYCYQSMFAGCTSLETAPALPSAELKMGCYSNMFDGCKSLKTAPELPATTLARGCYQYMFQGCKSLTDAPVLPATTLDNYCYYSMFYNCTSLTTAPELPATTLAIYCYANMFRGCTSLVYIPSFNGIDMKAGYTCGQMFADCINLKSIPNFSGCTFGDDSCLGMFNNCTSITDATIQNVSFVKKITQNGGDIKYHISSYALKNFFYGCISLSKLTFKNIDFGYFGYSSVSKSNLENWLYGTSPTGNLITTVNGINADSDDVPSGWTITHI